MSEYNMAVLISTIDWRNNDSEDVNDQVINIIENPKYINYDINKDIDDLESLGLDKDQIMNYLQVLLIHSTIF